MAASNPTDRRHRWVLLLSVLSMGLMLLIGYGLWRYLQIDAISELLGKVKRLDVVMRGLRWCVIAVLAVSWSALIEQCCRRRWVSKYKRSRLINARWRAVAWLIFIELMIGTPVLPWVIRQASA